MLISTKTRLFFIVASLLFAVISQFFCFAKSSELLQEIEFLSINNRNQIKSLEAKIKDITSRANIGKKDQLLLVRHIDRRQELILRQDFIRRLISHVDNHYTNQPKITFLIDQLSKMAQNEAKSREVNKSFLTFILNCRQVLVDRPPEQNNPVELIERYMKFTHITKNKTAAKFYEESDYSNRSESYTARDISVENIRLQDDALVTNADKAREDIDLSPTQSEQEWVTKQILLQEHLKEKVEPAMLKQSLGNTQKVDETSIQKFMNQSDFKKLFNKED